jgi:hypothetical protein
MDTGFEKALQIANHKHDLIAVRVTDLREKEIPNVGLLRAVDPETGKMRWIDTGSKNTRKKYASWSANKTKQLDALFSRYGVDVAKVYTGQDYVKPLMNLFRKRSARR